MPFDSKKHTTKGGLPFYSSWAFSENEREKAKANKRAFDEFVGRFVKVWGAEKEQQVKDNPDKLLFYESDPTYGQRHFHTIQNPEGLSAAEIALIVDRGSLCFGFAGSADHITIFTD